MTPAFIPLPEAGTHTDTTPAGGNWTDTLTGWTNGIPSWIWVIAFTATFAATLIAFPVLRRQAYKAGRRAAGTTTPQDRRDKQLLAAALAPAILFWFAVLFGSARGLISFGRDDLRWTDGWEYLVPFTLDGVAISFGVLAFRAVSKERNPDRAYRIVWVATLASAAINFFHEVNGSLLGAGYLAILSLFGMLIFHEFLAQFEEGAAWIKRDNPKFGLRWFTWPTNTICAWFAWRNYPPAEDTDATVRAAVAHLEKVRADKASQRAQKVDTPAWWMTLAPWVRSAQLATALAEQRAATRQQTDELTARLTETQEALNDMTIRLTTVEVDLDKATGDLAAARDKCQSLTDQLDEEVRNGKDRNAKIEELQAALTEQSKQPTTAGRDKAPVDITAYRRTAAHKGGSGGANVPAMSDEAAVQAMLNAHDDPTFEWSKNAVRTLTGVGYGRAPRLIELWYAAVTGKAAGKGDAAVAVNQ